ncbi:MAG: hypothetical protein KIT73_20980, partial [Burkholderiales bacterium]|nr:hypothetical protein [Burkholderiales bacterium]
RPWADAERRRRRHARLYMWLMTLEQELSGAMGDGGIELVWGFAIGVRRHGDQAQAYPLLTQAVDLRFHAATGTAEITPRSNDPRIELDAFDPAENPALAALEAEVRREIQSSHGDLSPFTPDAFLALAERFRPVLDPAAAERPEPEQLRFTPGWVLFARPRGGGAVVEDLDRFAEQLAGHDDIRLPPAVAALVTEPSSDRPASMLPRYRGLSGEGGAAAPDAVGKPRDLCLPKPYNDEQVRIVQLLDMHDGVAVQGPPGTGKTHTIANLICHCLAQGQRVLVTSMKDPALTVLREQLPAPLRPLAITLLGEEQAESEQFETAIEVIAKEVQSIDPESVGEHVERLGFRLDALHARLAEIDATLLRLARRELDPIVLDGEAVPTTHAAESVAQALGTFEWIPDMLGTGAEFRPQFTVADIAAMYEARERIGDSLDHVGHVLPDPDSFPSGTTLLRIHHDLLRLGAAARPETSVDGPVLADPGPEIVPRLRALSETVARVWALRREILREG